MAENSKTTNKQGLTHIFLLIIVILAAIGAVGYFAYQNAQLKNGLNQPTPAPEMVEITPSPANDAFADWKTYTSKYGYSFKYPADYEIKTTEWNEGVWQYGPSNDDEAILRYVEPEQPPHGGFPYGNSISLKIPKQNPDNFSIDKWVENTLSDDIEMKREFIMVSGSRSMKVSVIMDGEVASVFIPHNGNVYRIISNWSRSEQSPNYDEIFNQILSTFEFLDNQQDVDSWNTYRNEKYGFSVDYNPESPPTEFAGTEDSGQFSYLLKVNFGTNPIKFPNGYNLKVSQQKTLEDYRKELIGHKTDAIISEQKISINGIDWLKLNYQIFLTTDYVPVTTAFANNNQYGFAITSSTLDIDQILSTFRFLD